MVTVTTDNFFGKGNKDNRVKKRLERKGERAKGRGVRRDAKKGITPEHREALNKAELQKAEAEVKQDEAVAAIAQTLPTASPTPAKNNTLLWFVLLLFVLLVVAVLVFLVF